jgi:hypothetical protein
MCSVPASAGDIAGKQRPSLRPGRSSRSGRRLSATVPASAEGLRFRCCGHRSLYRLI